MRSLLRHGLSLSALGLSLFAAGHSGAAGPDPAARGLDAFVQAASAAYAGGFVDVQLETYGFPTVTAPTPLGGVAIEAAWDPRTFETHAAVAPPSVLATTDRAATTVLHVPVPDGDERSLTLLVRMRLGDHSRTRELKVTRRAPVYVELDVPDATVVPGSFVTAWVKARSAATGEPLANKPVRVKLMEGTYARHVIDAVSDASGLAMVRLPIPPNDDPTWSWDLVAEVPDVRAKIASVRLAARDETPGEPSLRAHFDAPSVDVGQSLGYRLVARDGSGAPIANAPIRVWTGSTGMSPPKEDADWEKVTTLLQTDPAGVAVGTVTAPTVVSPSKATKVQFVARVAYEGRKLESGDTANVGLPQPEVQVLPEAGSLVPGLAQRVSFRLRDAKDKGMAGETLVEGDGLKTKLTTDVNGEGEITWNVPADVGARRDRGPCAGDVAATVRLTPLTTSPELASAGGPHLECLRVDRDAKSIVRADRSTVRVGDKVTVHVDATKRDPAPWSYSLASGTEQGSVAWSDAASQAQVSVAEGTSGIWSLTATQPVSREPFHAASTALLVLPRILPRVTAQVTGGRLAPNGNVEVDATLVDERGQPLAGSVQALLVDLEGGASLSGLEAQDTRHRICRELGVEDARCDAVLTSDAASEPVRRALLAGRGSSAATPLTDPGGTAKDTLNEAFAHVLRSLEGAVYEATSSPERLRDVKRKGTSGAWTFNPELLTLTTAAMDEPPLTPGGEAITLSDLVAVDPQVTFDTVARRVTRLKLFRVLQAVRTAKQDRHLADDEPIWKDPNALLRRMVRDGTLAESSLLDPWGGTMQFAKTAAVSVPFLSVLHGFELRAPGPDGTLGTGDDVRDPFERVVRSGTPYAVAMSEDRLVDAKYDMEVADATVAAWDTTLTEATGTALGDITGHGSGTGTGQGFGSGSGRLGGSHATSRVGVSFFAHTWASAPLRTDKNGKVHFTVPLGPYETRWGIGLLAHPDAAPPAATVLSVPVALPLSVTVESGGAWTEGDEAGARIVVRNRSATATRATLRISAKEATQLLNPSQASSVLDVPAGGMAVTTIRVRATKEGTGSLTAEVSAPSLPDDAFEARFPVQAAGEVLVRTRAVWVSSASDVRVDVDAGHRLTGRPKLVVERGFAHTLDAALGALDPDTLTSPADLADAVEAAVRIERWSTTGAGVDAPRTKRAHDLLLRARGRFAIAVEPVPDADLKKALVRRADLIAPSDGPKRPVADLCPNPVGKPTDQTDLHLALAAAEPPPEQTGALPCWDAFVSDLVHHVTSGDSAVELARLYLVLAERTHRSVQAETVLSELRRRVMPSETGAISLPSSVTADRSLVYAALVRGAKVGASLAPRDRLAGWLLVGLDARGSFGSPAATLAAVEALLTSELSTAASSDVRVRFGAVTRDLHLAGDEQVEVPLDPGTTSAAVEVRGAPVFVRLVRPVFRPFGTPAELLATPLSLEVEWPKEPAVGKNLLLHVTLREHTYSPDKVRLRARIPLPPGVTIAAPVAGVKQLGGALLVQLDIKDNGYVDVPIRFATSGKMSTREAQILAPVLGTPRGVAPAQTLIVR